MPQRMLVPRGFTAGWGVQATTSLGQRDSSPQRVLQVWAASALLIPVEKGKAGAGCFT